MGIDYLGTVVKGGVEGIKVQPKWMTKIYMELIYDLGQHLALDWELNPVIVNKLAKPERLSFTALTFYRLLSRLRLLNFYWDSQLKKNKAFENRFAQPYSKP